MEAMTSPRKPTTPAGQPAKAVTYQHTMIFGFIAAMVVFVSTVIFTQAWKSLTALGLSVLYTAITFVVVTAVAALLNWVTRNDTQHENTEFPVLK
ncbi:VIT1/CCC1 family predicted Fe2+/Mn2+ transporter [Brevibacterium pityocampae]